MRAIGATLVLAALLAGCSGGEGEGLVSPAPELSGPSALPESFPLPDGAERTQFTSTGSGGLIAQFSVEAPQGRILSFYETELNQGGWRVTGSEPTELFTVVRFAGNGWGGQLTIVKGPPTKIAVAMNREPTTGG